MIKVDRLLKQYCILDCVDQEIYDSRDSYWPYSSYCNVLEGQFIHKTVPNADANGYITINLPVVFSKILRLREPFHLYPSLELFLPSLKYIGRSRVYYYIHNHLLRSPESSIYSSPESKSKQAFFNQMWYIGNSEDIRCFSRRSRSARCEFSIRKIDDTYYLGNDLFLLDVTHNQLLYYIEGNYNYKDSTVSPTVNYYVLHVNSFIFNDLNKLVNKIIAKDIIPIWAQQGNIYTFSDGAKPIRIEIHRPELMEPALNSAILRDAVISPASVEKSVNNFLHKVSDKLTVGEYYTAITT
jgi:hypothetical protein